MENNNLEFIRLTPDDLAELINISRTTFYNSYASLNTAEDIQDYMTSAFNREKLKQGLSEVDSEFYFVKWKEETLGYLKINFGENQSVTKEMDGMELERIYVLEKFQGRKIGKSMIDFIAERARERKLEYVWLGVWMKNTKAIAFYEKNGFNITGTHPFKLGDDLQTDYIMRRNLSLINNNVNT